MNNKLALLLKMNFIFVDIFMFNSSFVVDNNFHFDIGTLLCVFDDDDVFCLFLFALVSFNVDNPYELAIAT